MTNLPVENLKYCNETLELKATIEGGFLTLAEHLYNIKTHNLFEPQWSSFLEFCDELRMSQNNINKLIQIHEKFVLEYGIDKEQIKTAGGWSTLQEILPMVSSKKLAVKWLESASLLSRADLRKNIIEEKTGIDMRNCFCDTDYYIIKICRKCGKRISIPDDKNISKKELRSLR